MQNLEPLRVSGQVAHFTLAPTKSANGGELPSSVSLFDQGLTQMLEAAVSGLRPKQQYVLALATRADGGGSVQPLAAFTTNPAGSAIVNAVRPIRQIIAAADNEQRRYLVVVEGTADKLGNLVQVQAQ
jgi:hypothetical protein